MDLVEDIDESVVVVLIPQLGAEVSDHKTLSRDELANGLYFDWFFVLFFEYQFSIFF